MDGWIGVDGLRGEEGWMDEEWMDDGWMDELKGRSVGWDGRLLGWLGMLSRVL